MNRPRNFLIISLALLIGSALLGFAAKGAGPLPGDLPVSQAAVTLLPFNKTVQDLWTFIGEALRYSPLIVLAVTLLLRKWDWALLVALVCVPVFLYGESLLKPLFNRPRPTNDLVIIYRASKGLSFPSGTAMSSMAVAGLAIYFARQSGESDNNGKWTRMIIALSLSFLLLCNFARIHVGAHWVSDIIGGWMFGGTWLTLLIAGHQWWIARRSIEN